MSKHTTAGAVTVRWGNRQSWFWGWAWGPSEVLPPVLSVCAIGALAVTWLVQCWHVSDPTHGRVHAEYANEGRYYSDPAGNWKRSPLTVLILTNTHWPWAVCTEQTLTLHTSFRPATSSSAGPERNQRAVTTRPLTVRSDVPGSRDPNPLKPIKSNSRKKWLGIIWPQGTLITTFRPRKIIAWDEGMEDGTEGGYQSDFQKVHNKTTVAVAFV